MCACFLVYRITTNREFPAIHTLAYILEIRAPRLLSSTIIQGQTQDHDQVAHNHQEDPAMAMEEVVQGIHF